MNTAYNINQILENEVGWLFYDAALKNWKVINSLLAGASVLDIGCGSGISMALGRIFNPNMNFVGLEGSAGSSSELWLRRNLTVEVGNIYNLPFADGSFDTVYSSHVLEHLVDPQRAISESIRVAKKRVIHSVPDGNVDEKNFGTPHLHRFDRRSLRQLFDNMDVRVYSYVSVPDIHISSLVIAVDKS